MVHELRFKGLPALNLTDEMVEAAEIVAEEIRGNIKRGTDPSEQVSHRLNAPNYARWKIKNLGHQKPLIAKYKRLIEKSSYIIERKGINKVNLRLTRATHPGSSASISEIGFWNQTGTDRIPPRPFFTVSSIAVKRIKAKMADKIRNLIHAKGR